MALAAAVGVATLATSPAAHAAATPVSWSNSAGGNFADAANWNGGAGPVPTHSHDARFDLVSSYQTVFAGSPTTAALTVAGSDVTFRGDGFANRTYFTPDAVFESGTLTLGPSLAGPPRPPSLKTNFTLNASNLNIKSGGRLVVNGGNAVQNGNGLNIATTASNGAIGALVVDGAGSSFTTSAFPLFGSNGGVAQLTFSNNATGTFGYMTTPQNANRFTGAHLAVNGGADVTTTGYFQWGWQSEHPDQRYSVTVSGAGSTLTQNMGFMTFGTANSFATPGQATVTVTDGGTLTTSSSGYGVGIHRGAMLDFTGGTLDARGSITVSHGGILRRGATGTFNWTADYNRQMHIQSGGLFEYAGDLAPASPNQPPPYVTRFALTDAGSKMLIGGSLTLARQSEASVASGALLSAAALTVASPNGDDAKVMVDGAGSSLAVTGAGTFGGANLNGTLTVSNNAAASFGGPLTLRSGSHNLTSTVQSGADLTAGHVTIGHNLGNVTLLVTGAGSTVTQSGAAGVTINRTGALTVEKGAVFTTGTGGLVMTGGIVQGSEGTLNVNGNINLAGGLFGMQSSPGTGGSGLVWAPGKSMTITDGSLYARDLLNLAGNTMSVSGSNAYLSLHLVALRGGSTLDVSNWGRASMLALGVGTDGTGGTATVNGANSRLEIVGWINSTIGRAVGAPATVNVLNGAEFTTQQMSSSVTINPTGTINSAGGKVVLHNLTINGGKLKHTAAGSLRLRGTLAITDGGQLDLADGATVVRGGNVGSSDGANYSGLTGLIDAGRNDQAWNGTGIVTSVEAALDGLTTLGIGTAEELGLTGETWHGHLIADGDVLIAYTHAGDANLDGAVDGGDYAYIDAYVGATGANVSYTHGDFNYDSAIDGGDYAYIDVTVGSAPFSTAAAAGSVTVVPEPVSGVGGVALVAAVAGSRGRRRCVRELRHRPRA